MNTGKEYYKKGNQPCNNFQVSEEGIYCDLVPHDCYKCRKSTVAFCKNCFRDHHYNGYETCEAPNDK